MSEKSRIVAMLKDVGVTINGPDPWDPQILNDNVWNRVFAQGSLGLGEAYMDGWWECGDLAEFFARVLRAGLGNGLGITPNLIWQHLQARFLNMQTLSRARRVARIHYNETEAYKATLDSRLTGSCAYWERASTLDEAQDAKLDLVCRKIGLKRGDRVWDVGCGWGAFMGFAAEKYGADCVGVTISPDQAAYGRERYKSLPVEFQVKDYREFTGKADHIVSMGMFEHVGYKNFRTYFEAARRALNEGGLFMLHTIGSSVSTTTIDPWMEKYIFPGGVLPSLTQIGKAIEGLFDVIDLHNIGPHYDRTLTSWFDKFHANWPRPNTPDEHRFYRMWKYYLLSCAGGFRARGIHVWQFVLSTSGVPEGYRTAR
ncbi:MAG: cyclopropane fatty acyl phospholipid synthase [Cucumibacter sp.]